MKKLLLLLFLPLQLLGIAEKLIIVVIPSYNNEKWCERNLTSVYAQDYSNYKVIYVNDCSKDKTGEIVQQFIIKNELGNQFFLINNPSNQGALYNLYHSIHACPDDAIVLTLDGDDWLAHKNVLKRINHEYSTKDIWMTWGQYRTTRNEDGCCKPIPTSIIKSENVRRYMWVMSHPRTFYAKLFKQIKKEDLMYENEFFDVSWDLGMMFPMLEMAGLHHSFISDVLYIYNVENPINDNKIKAERIKLLDGFIKNKPIYKVIHKLF